MKITKKNLPKSKIELTVEIPFEDVKPFMIKSAAHISMHGFRPGNAPYEAVKQKIGEEKLLENSLSDIIKKTLMDAFTQEKIDALGEPHVDIEKFKLEEPLIYKATVSLLPKAELSEYKSLKIKRREVKADPEEINMLLTDMQERRAKEALVERKSKKGDKVNINIEMSLDKAPLEGGQFKNHDVIIGKDIFPGEFNKNLEGMGKNEEKSFEVEYPKEHFDKILAGKSITFKVKINDIYEIELPELNDEFAKNAGGFEKFDELKKHIENLILKRNKENEDARFEGEIFEKLINNGKFDELPDILLESEKDKMVSELEANILSQGGAFDDYLAHIKKTREDLKNDFAEMSEKRIKTSLAIRKIAEDEDIKVDDNEIDAEIKKMLKLYRDNPAAVKNLQSENYKNYFKNVLLNKIIISKLKEWNEGET
ncbi:MAG: trigger factor [bacterium]